MCVHMCTLTNMPTQSVMLPFEEYSSLNRPDRMYLLYVHDMHIWWGLDKLMDELYLGWMMCGLYLNGCYICNKTLVSNILLSMEDDTVISLPCIYEMYMSTIGLVNKCSIEKQFVLCYLWINVIEYDQIGVNNKNVHDLIFYCWQPNEWWGLRLWQ